MTRAPARAQNRRGVKFWLPIIGEDTTQLLDLARCAEACGFEGVALADHVGVPLRFASRHPSGETPFDHYASVVLGERLEDVLPLIVDAV